MFLCSGYILGGDISTSASTSPVDSTSTGNTLLYYQISDHRELNKVTSQDPVEHF